MDFLIEWIIGLAAFFGILLVISNPLINHLNNMGAFDKTREQNKCQSEINQKYKVGLRSALIAIICLVGYFFLCDLILDEYGRTALMYVLCAFLFLPSSLICVVLITFFVYGVHFSASRKDK